MMTIIRNCLVNILFLFLLQVVSNYNSLIFSMRNIKRHLRPLSDLLNALFMCWLINCFPTRFFILCLIFLLRLSLSIFFNDLIVITISNGILFNFGCMCTLSLIFRDLIEVFLTILILFLNYLYLLGKVIITIFSVLTEVFLIANCFWLA